jgi:hypothetical protein
VHDDAAAAPVVLDRVREQVDQHLAQPRRVAARCAARLGDLDRDAVLRRQRFDQRHRLAHEHAEVDRAEASLSAPDSRLERSSTSLISESR